MSRDGDCLILEPVRKAGLAALLETWQVEGEQLPDIVDPPPDPENIF